MTVSSFRRTLAAGLLGLATTLITGAAPATAGNPAIVRTDAGLVRGTLHDGYRTFHGIPYAAPPTGDLRWRPPQPVAPWPDVREADAPGPACKQNSPGHGGPRSGAEDCLYLNVTTPLGKPHRRPVVVWLHGGSFQTGSGGMYDAHRLAVRGDVVVVTVNYRLGVFGFLGLPGLAGSGTFGLQDQQAALRWVRRNAAAFGGDPRNVTLAGQSAGGLSACAHLASPAAAGLFDRAVLQSGPCLTDWPAELSYPDVEAGSPFSPVADVRRAGAELAATLHCGADVAACLRAQPADALLQHTEGVGLDAFLNPAHGTALLPRHPADALRAGAFHRVPVLSGNTRDEHRGMIAFVEAGSPVTAERYAAVLKAAFGDRAGQVAAAYPVEAYASPAQAWAAVATDRIWACPTLAGNRLFARHTPTFAYEFAEGQGPWGAYHGSELPYLFDVAPLPPPAGPALAEEMIDAWSRFAATGGAGWPRLRPGAATPYVRTLATGASGGVDLAAEHRCGLWTASTPVAG
ncbi:carboxylesterase/lipase family protein [Couchioplanes azureus]|uniref:carboxylesterase/lipase family protein n=1 Tax=Couchioplanes caeruleus TaxID=56438 RepID=UPI0016717993|nr:carboxylesterase family protein [Couchioplanes caeruleus]GGQ52574.1 carboxylic ester hydrolase [Couchioplanes caeruleus subsp. azureus]